MGKHRETQVQLQKKLQEREHFREQKRKLQVRMLPPNFFYCSLQDDPKPFMWLVVTLQMFEFGATGSRCAKWSLLIHSGRPQRSEMLLQTCGAAPPLQCMSGGGEGNRLVKKGFFSGVCVPARKRAPGSPRVLFSP